jgi:hypothetical protein
VLNGSAENGWAVPSIRFTMKWTDVRIQKRNAVRPRTIARADHQHY